MGLIPVKVFCVSLCTSRFCMGFVNPEHFSAFRNGWYSLLAQALLIDFFLLSSLTAQCAGLGCYEK